MANRKSYDKIRTKIRATSKAGLKALKNDRGHFEVDTSEMNFNELRRTLTILNNEANRRLEVAKNRINKSIKAGKKINEILGNDVADIYEFNPLLSGRIDIYEDKKYGVRGYKQWSGITKEQVIREIKDRESFLNKKASTITGFKDMKRQQKTDFDTFIMSELDARLGRKSTKADVQAVSKLIDRLKDKNYIFRSKTLNPNYIGTDIIVQNAIQAITATTKRPKDMNIENVINEIEYKFESEKLKGSYQKKKNELALMIKVLGESAYKDRLKNVERGYKKKLQELEDKYLSKKKE